MAVEETDLKDIDLGEVRAAFEDVSSILGGRPPHVAISALVDLVAAWICRFSTDQGAAIANTEEFRDDLQGRIEMHFDYYHDGEMFH